MRVAGRNKFLKLSFNASAGSSKPIPTGQSCVKSPPPIGTHVILWRGQRQRAFHIGWPSLHHRSGENAGGRHETDRDCNSVTLPRGAGSSARAQGKQDGTTVIRYRSIFNLSLTRYDLYVSGQKQCGPGEVATGAGVPTTDTDYCPVHKCIASNLFVAR